MAIEQAPRAAGGPGLSVVVAFSSGANPTPFVESLAHQALDQDFMEVIVVEAGAVPGDPGWTAAASGPPVRRLRVSDQNPARANLLGLRSARRDFVTFLRPADGFAVGALSAATRRARPDELVAVGAEPKKGTGGTPEDDVSIGPTPPASGGHSDVPRLEHALISGAHWVIPTWLASSAASTADPGRWWELLLLARIRCLSRARMRWAPGTTTSPERLQAPTTPHISWHDVGPLLGAIAELEDLAIQDPECAGSLEPVVRQLARQLRPLLVQEPGLRAPLMDAVLEARVRQFPYSELTGGLASDLAIAYAFPPSLDTSAIVAARRLRERGAVTDVVSCEQEVGVDPGTSVIAGGFVDRKAELPGPASYGQWPDIEAFVLSGLATVEAWVDQGRAYTSLYSRSMWPASHMLAALIKLRMPGLIWSAEFSDPMQRTIRGRTRFDPMDMGSPVVAELLGAMRQGGLPLPTSDNLWEWTEHVPFALADEVLFTNGNQREAMLAGMQHQQLRERAGRHSSICPHPTPPRPFYRFATPPYPLDPALVHLGYFGTFYPNRGIGEVLSAIRDSPHHVQQSLHLHVFSDDPASVVSQAQYHGIHRFVSSNPYLPYFDFLNMTRLVDLLVVNDTDTRGTHPINPYLPSKLSDYIGSGTSIWAIYEPGSALSRVSVRYSSELDDAGAARNVLAEATAGRPTKP